MVSARDRLPNSEVQRQHQHARQGRRGTDQFSMPGKVGEGPTSSACQARQEGD